MLENKIVATGQATSGGVLVWLSQFDLSQWSYIAGIFGVLVGVFGGLWWQWRRDKREEKIAKAKIVALAKHGVVIDDEVLD